MVKQWVQPPINKHRLPLGGFSLGPDLANFIFYFHYSGFHWNIGGKLRNPVFGNILF
jgi:hypothetical protein